MENQKGKFCENEGWKKEKSKIVGKFVDKVEEFSFQRNENVFLKVFKGIFSQITG